MLSIIVLILKAIIIGYISSGLVESFGYFNIVIAYIGLIIGFYSCIKESSIFKNIIFVMFGSMAASSQIDFSVPNAIINYFPELNKNSEIIVSLLMGVFRFSYLYFFVLFKHIVEKYIKFQKVQSMDLIITSLIFTIIQSLSEYLFPSQFGYSFNHLIDHLNFLPIIGIEGYSFILTLLFLTISFNLLYKNKIYLNYFIIALFIIANTIYNNKDQSYDTTESLKVRLVQYPFHLLNKENNNDSFLSFDLKEAFHNNSKDLDLVVFPESSYPIVYKNYYLNKKDMLMREILKNNFHTLMAVYKKEQDYYYNTSMLVHKSKIPEFYYKRQLFPLGEYNISLLNNIIGRKESFVLKSKVKDNIFKINKHKFLTLLCFENYTNDILNSYNVKIKRESSFIVIQSNESWIASKKMRNYLINFTKILAKTYNMFVIKSDSKGPSFIVNNQGIVTNIIEQNYKTIDVLIPKKREVGVFNELYLNYGLKIYYFLLLLSIFCKIILLKK